MHMKSSELVPDVAKTQELSALSFIITIVLSHKRKHTEMALNLTHGDQALKISGNIQRKFHLSNFSFFPCVHSIKCSLILKCI